MANERFVELAKAKRPEWSVQLIGEDEVYFLIDGREFCYWSERDEEGNAQFTIWGLGELRKAHDESTKRDDINGPMWVLTELVLGLPWYELSAKAVLEALGRMLELE